MKIKYISAPVYKNLLPSAILELNPDEQKATCDRCLMARPPTAVKDRYQDHLKCCTYYPFLPNFAVGAILKDPKGIYKKGQETIRKIIKKRQYSLPIGLVAPVKYQLEFKDRKKGDFGNQESWLCPYYDRQKNQCSIWAYRGAVCTSFYCRSSYGKKGLNFWHQMSDYLTYVEMALMEEALIRLDFSPRQISEELVYLNGEEGTLAEKKSWSLPEKKARYYWRDYFEDQEGFFIKCFDLVESFDRKAFREMMGEQGFKLETMILDRFGKLG
jgi:hypothetical protein